MMERGYGDEEKHGFALKKHRFYSCNPLAPTSTVFGAVIASRQNLFR